MRYNNPFYFALPLGRASTAQLSEALAHIAQTFGVTGRVEHVRSELAFHLFKVTAS